MLSNPPTGDALPKRATKRVQTSVLFYTPLLTELNHTRADLPNKYHVKTQPVSLRLTKLTGVKTIRLRTKRKQLILATPSNLRKTRVALHFPDMKTARALLLTTTYTENEAVLQKTTQRPRVTSLTTFLGQYNNYVRKTNDSALHVRKQQNLSKYYFSPLPSHVFTSALTYNYTTTNNQIRLANYTPTLCTPILRVLKRVKYEIRPTKSVIQVSHFKQLRKTNQIFAKTCPTLTASTTPLLTTTVLYTSDRDDVRSIVFRHQFNYTRNFYHLNTRTRATNEILAVTPNNRLHNAIIRTPSLQNKTTLILTKLTTQKAAIVARPTRVSQNCTKFARVLTNLKTRVQQRSTPRGKSTGGASTGGRVYLTVKTGE